MDWAELNPELLRLIAKKLFDFVDFMRLRAMCRHWRSAMHPSDLNPQLPCLVSLHPYVYLGDSCKGYIKLISFYTKKTYSIPCFFQPQLIEKRTLSPIGYQFLLSDPSWGPEQLFNPITGVQVSIPFGWYCECCKVSSHPSGEVILSKCGQHRSRTISMWRYTGQNWTKIFEVLHGFKDTDEMVSYFNGKLYTVDMITRKTEVIDVATGEVELRIEHPSVMFQYLINACGDLLGVQICEPNHLKFKFEIYRLEATENPRWAKLNGGIGNRVLFLDDNIKTGFCLNASEFDGFRGNRIYLIHRALIARYDLEAHKLEVSPLSHSTGTWTWFVPRITSSTDLKWWVGCQL